MPTPNIVPAPGILLLRAVVLEPEQSPSGIILPEKARKDQCWEVLAGGEGTDAIPGAYVHVQATDTDLFLNWGGEQLLLCAKERVLGAVVR